VTATLVQTLNRRLLEHVSAGTTDLAAGDRRLDTSRYTCPERFARERQALFRLTPQPVAFAAELQAPGSYLALTVAGVPLLLARDAEHRLRALRNRCAHRGAPLARGQGTATGFVCPFHGWAFRLDGSLRGRPADAAFDSGVAETGLEALPVSERCGIIVVGLEETVSQHTVDNALEPLAEELDDYRLQAFQPLERRQLQCAANWKLVCDLSLESYHFNRLHRDSVATVLADNAIVDTWDRHSRWAFPLKSITALAELPVDAWPDSLQGSCTYTLYPGVMLIINDSGAQMIRAEPGSRVGESLVTYSGVRRAGVDAGAARAAFDFGGEVFSGEDLPMAEQCQRGFGPGQTVVFGRNEPLLQFWHRLWDTAVQAPAEL
jgi:phenylpropionate dioxygenase-like ring-hydroxylating dioxygenase large terminal subunit